MTIFFSFCQYEYIFSFCIPFRNLSSVSNPLLSAPGWQCNTGKLVWDCVSSFYIWKQCFVHENESGGAVVCMWRQRTMPRGQEPGLPPEPSAGLAFMLWGWTPVVIFCVDQVECSERVVSLSGCPEKSHWDIPCYLGRDGRWNVCFIRMSSFPQYWPCPNWGKHSVWHIDS